MESEDQKNQISKKQPNDDSSAGDRFASLILSAILGFGGGMLAVRIGGDDFSTSNLSSQGVTQQIVNQQGEIIADLADEVTPSVVSINVKSITTSFSPFFGQSEQESQGEGSGIIISSDGLVLTNKHVVPENSTDISIIMSDGQIFDDVEVIGREAFNDLAYLRINGVDNLTPAKLGDSDEVRVGQQVVAIGNALGEFDTTVTSGIISGKGRPIVAGVGSDSEQLANLFQTDASINPGNSGGPLLNIDGEVIGVNTAVAGNAENIGFAIPINDVKPGITSIENNGKLVRPYLGVRYVTLTSAAADELEVPVEEGALIYDPNGEAIIKDSPAEKANLKNRDVIIEVEGVKVSAEMPLPNLVSRYQVGERIALKVLRDNNEVEVFVDLEAVPDSL